MEQRLPPLLVCSLLLSWTTFPQLVNSTNSSHLIIRDGDTLASSGGSFELGFFAPGGDGGKRFLGIWYKNILDNKTVVWVANRQVPLQDSSGALKLTDGGLLVLATGNGSVVWSSNSSKPALNPVTMLLDSGNLAVQEKEEINPENFLWQSFDYPGDTFLPGMKIRRNIKTGQNTFLRSWKALDDPSPGDFTNGFELGGFPELILWEGSTEKYRAGPWNGLRFSGGRNQMPNPPFAYEFVFDEQEVSYSYKPLNASVPLRVRVSPTGKIERYTWINRTKGWVEYFTVQADECDEYALCGAYGTCNIALAPSCSCLRGFMPKFQKQWDLGDWSNGCIRNTYLNCSSDGFLKYSNVKLPETRISWFSRSMNLEECKTLCKKNCSCTAYATLDIRGGGSGCLLWFGALIDIRQFTENGQEIYIRIDASELKNMGEMEKKDESKKRRRTFIFSTLSLGVLILLLILLANFWRRKHRRSGRCGKEISYDHENQSEDLDLPFFDLATISTATSNFSAVNLLGQGGFGSVFKGVLKDGREIAVKRLSKNSTQGLDELKNEVRHIAKLQHRNLVKLLGCCIQTDEKILIYELMPNKSLDLLIFDDAQSKSLTWPRRYHIIRGIAYGLVYLHQDSRLRIIHRDLKAANILLDNEMNPKISDFGLARSFGEGDAEANTRKVVGTYGYIAPEYAIHGHYSTKSDVFSFGVLVLEIISGKKIRGFCHPDHHLNLLGHAWTLYNEGRHLELLAAQVMDSCNSSEALRCVQIGLLCVQRNPEKRPSMAQVVLMLGGEGQLPQPNQPGYFTEREVMDVDSSSSHCHHSRNEVTVTLLEAR